MQEAPDSVERTEHAPHCEVGCVANVVRRYGIDLKRQVIGAHWAARTLVREVGGFPQPLLDRTQPAFTAQGAGWPELLARTAGVASTDRNVPREEIAQVLREDLREGGSLLFLEDRACPWLDAGRSPGMLPHAVVPDGVEDGTWQLVEGHSWWRGRYAMSEEDLLRAAYPDPDPHGVAGRVMSLRLPARPGPDAGSSAAELDAAARRELGESLHRYTEGGQGAQETPAGRIVWADGPGAVDLLVSRLRGWEYLADLAEVSVPSDEQVRDLAVGRYLFLALTDELAFTLYARSGTRSLVEGFAGQWPPARGGGPEAAWHRAWRGAQRMYRKPGRENLDTLLRELENAAEEDAAFANKLLGVL